MTSLKLPPAMNPNTHPQMLCAEQVFGSGEKPASEEGAARAAEGEGEEEEAAGGAEGAGEGMGCAQEQFPPSRASIANR